MHNVHFVMNGKGGIGKSYVSGLIQQSYMEKNVPVMGIDTDPANATLLSHKEYTVEHIKLFDEGTQKLDIGNFDRMMESIFEFEGEQVIDVGASAFTHLSEYMLENQAFEMIIDAGKNVVLNTIIASGQEMVDTLHGMDSLAKLFPKETDLVVWLNEYKSEIKDNESGKTFEQMAAYERNKARIKGVIVLPKLTELQRRDVQQLTERRMSFAAAIKCSDFALMEKQRLKLVCKQIFQQMDQVFI